MQVQANQGKNNCDRTGRLVSVLCCKGINHMLMDEGWIGVRQGVIRQLMKQFLIRCPTERIVHCARTPITSHSISTFYFGKWSQNLTGLCSWRSTVRQCRMLEFRKYWFA